MQSSKFPFDIVFISGAPRSGTTVAHALICTSASVNQYIGECSYFSQLVRAFDRGMETFDTHTRYYFADQSEYADLHRGLLATVLTAHWRQLGQPNILVLKDPDMLPIIPSVAALVEQARFVILYRDPLDVIASRVQVQYRRNPNGDFLHHDNISGLAEEYTGGYRAIDALATVQPSRFLFQKYEKLVDQDFGDLQTFLGLHDLNPLLIWTDSRVQQKTIADDPWNSQLYFQPVSKESVGSYRKSLDLPTIGLIQRLCGPTVERLCQFSASEARL